METQPDPSDYFAAMRFLARTYRGFTRPWNAALDPRNGEDAYSALVAEHLGPDKTVIEAGCGHGAEALTLANKVAAVIAFDAVPDFIALAREAAARKDAGNVRFIVADRSPKRNGGKPTLPAADHSADLILSRRGPTSWIGDARRVVRPGGTLLQLAYMSTPQPDWNHELPESLRMPAEPESMPGLVYERLRQANISQLHSLSLATTSGRRSLSAGPAMRLRAKLRCPHIARPVHGVSSRLLGPGRWYPALPTRLRMPVMRVEPHLAIGTLALDA